MTYTSSPPALGLAPPGRVFPPGAPRSGWLECDVLYSLSYSIFAQTTTPGLWWYGTGCLKR